MEYYPFISIIVAAFNEEKVIAKRIENLINQNYPKDRMEIIIASDGSTDNMVEIAKRYTKEWIYVLDFKKNRGRAALHNDAVRTAKGEILIFTDADTEFGIDFLRNVVKYFRDIKVGCVVGNLCYKTKGTAISQSESFYWKYEKKLRELESKINILATSSGACMATRKKLWKDLGPIEDCDFTSPIDVVLQNYRVMFAHDAIAYDVPPSSFKSEFKARIRMTSKNLIGTLCRWGFRGYFKHPIIGIGLFSHKILRWLTPFFMLGISIGNLFLLDKGMVYRISLIGQFSFYTIATIGFVAELFDKRIPIISTIFSFNVAMLGIGMGVIKGIMGKAPSIYRMSE
ncbi:MAG: glycosyltransferase [Nitrospirota bacterium]